MEPAVGSSGRGQRTLDLQRWFQADRRASSRGGSEGMRREQHGRFVRGRDRGVPGGVTSSPPGGWNDLHRGVSMDQLTAHRGGRLCQRGVVEMIDFGVRQQYRKCVISGLNYASPNNDDNDREKFIFRWLTYIF